MVGVAGWILLVDKPERLLSMGERGIAAFLLKIGQEFCLARFDLCQARCCQEGLVTSVADCLALCPKGDTCQRQFL